MSESSRKAEVVPITFEKHPNADLLSIVRLGGFQCVVNTEQWAGKTNAVYIEPETTVQTDRPEFSFLKREGRDKEVVKAKRLRGEWSVGLLVPTPEGFNIGDDCWDYLELEHYEPEEEVKLLAGDCATAPPYWANLPKYDLENFRKYKYLFKDDDIITISEKINGANQSCVFSDGEYHVKSRNFWKKDDGNDFWSALHSNEPLKKFLRDNPNTIVHGEMTGKVKGFTYGLTQPTFYAFDIRTPDYQWMDAGKFLDICDANNILTPRVFERSVSFSEDVVYKHTDGEQWNNPKGIREGVVVKPLINRYEFKLNGRLALKCVSNVYLEKSK